MNVTKVITTKDYELFDRVYFSGTVFYISKPFREMASTVDRSKVFDDTGKLLGSILGHWFDFDNKELFKKYEELAKENNE